MAALATQPGPWQPQLCPRPAHFPMAALSSGAPANPEANAVHVNSLGLVCGLRLDIPVLPQYCPSIAPVLSQYCPSIVPVPSQDCPQRSRDCPSPAPRLSPSTRRRRRTRRVGPDASGVGPDASGRTRRPRRVGGSGQTRRGGRAGAETRELSKGARQAHLPP